MGSLHRRCCILLLGLLGGCRETPTRPPPPFTAALLDLSEEAGRLLGLPLPGRAITLRRLAELGDELLARRRRDGKAHPVALLNQLLFEERSFRREVDDPAIPFMLLPAVLEKKRGSCLGLSGLYLSLGETLGLPLAGVLAPGHLFVRYKGPAGARDIELLKEGRAMPAEWYVTRYRVPAASPLYLRSLSPEETLAVFRFNLANELRARGNSRAAIEQYRRVIARLPDHAEAHANLGLTHHLRRELDEAEAAYLRAQALSPDLPGLAGNLAALGAERRALASPARGSDGRAGGRGRR